MPEVDVALSNALFRLTTALAGIDMETALNALAIQLGVCAVISSEDKGNALSIVRAATSQARDTVATNWGRPEMDQLRRQAHGEQLN